MTTIYTCGHSNRPLEAFIGLMRGVNIQTLIDVRSRPSSRWCPWFNRASLMAGMEAAGIQYVWMGDQLGGLDRNRDFPGGIIQALEFAEEDPTAVMCSEMGIKNCHRREKLTPAFQEHGATVMDIFWDGTVVAAPSMVMTDTPVQEELFRL